MKKTLAVAAVATIGFVGGQGCITTAWHKSVAESASPTREFPAYAGGKVRTYKGFYRGQSTLAGNVYHEYVFPQALAGNKRALRLLLPVAPGGIPIVDEERVGADQKEPASAVLIRVEVCCLSDDQMRAFLFQERGNASDPAALLQKHFAFADPLAGEQRAVVVMDTANTQSMSFNSVVWQKSGDTWVVSHSGVFVNSYEKTDFRLAWSERSRGGYLVSHVFYVVTVALDIITAPFQLLGFAVMMALGPGAK